MDNSLDGMKYDEYVEYVKVQYYAKTGAKPDEDDEIDRRWKKLLNQIRSGQELELTNTQINIYAVEHSELDYAEREMIKSSLFEDIDDETIDKIANSSSAADMKKIKTDYYKALNVVKSVQGSINSIKNAVGDCEGKFEIFESYMKNFTEQIAGKDEEIKRLNDKITDLENKLAAKNDELSDIKIEYATRMAEIKNNGKEQSITINKVVDVTPVPESDQEPDKNEKKGFGFFRNKNKKQLKVVEDVNEEDSDKDSISEPKKYSKQIEKVEIKDLNEYILNADLDSEQLRYITKAIREGLPDKYIVSMIENHQSGEQMHASIALYNTRKELAEKKIQEQQEALKALEARDKKAEPVEDKTSENTSLVDRRSSGGSSDDFEEEFEEDGGYVIEEMDKEDFE